MPFFPGTILDNYKLLARVGSGSCGTVWQAENIVSGELEALKILTDKGLAERELRALKLYRGLNHPALIRIRHIGKIENTLFYTMDWCESSLAERKIEPKELLKSAKELADGLAMIHSHELLHRDIKPANIFFRQGVPVLGDIGLLTLQKGATFAGTPGFLAPSILSGKYSADRYSDCYALAKTIYCALSGLEPEQFPLYMGEITPETSLLMRAVIAVCSEKNEIHNAEEFLAFLNDPPKKKKKHFFLIWLSIGIAVALLYFLFLHKNTENLSIELQTSPIFPIFSRKERNSTAIQQLKQKNLDLEKNPDRTALLKKWINLPPEFERKKQNLQQSQEVYELIGLKQFGRMRTWTQKEEVFLISKFTAEQKKVYLECCSEIRRIESTEKWQQFSAILQKKDYRLQLDQLESAKGLSPMSALQQTAKQDPVLDLFVKQSQCRLIREKMLRDTKRGMTSNIGLIFGDFVEKTGVYSKTFRNFKIPDHQ